MLFPLRVLAIFAGAFAAYGQPTATITGSNGTGVIIYGTALSSSITAFYQIPFAQPPTGNLRFRPPQQPPNYSPIINASTFGPTCIQTSTTLGPQSEDCLYLNVFRPNGYENQSLPVFVYFYGGSFTSGGAQATNFTALVQQSAQRGLPIIVVTPNYRLGPFGGGYGQEYLQNGATNLGIQDAAAAINWVGRNIAGFGGDCDRITIGGSSAGAVAASMMLLVNPAPKFAGVYLNSGSPSANPLAPTTEGYPEVYPMLVNYTGCTNATNTFECLRGVSAQVLNNATARVQSSPAYTVGFPWNPNVDYGFLPGRPHDLLQQGKFQRVPVMAGDDLDEGTVFVSTATNSTASVVTQVDYLEPVVPPTNVTDQLLVYYPNIPALGAPYGTGNQTFGFNAQFKRIASLYGDLAFQHSRRWLMQQMNANGFNQTWSWQFEALKGGGPETYVGVSHTLDNSYFLGQITNATGGPGGAGLSSLMVQYLLNFVYTQNPNGQSQYYWPTYAEDCGITLLQFSGNNVSYSTQIIADDFRKEGIAYINQNPVAFNS